MALEKIDIKKAQQLAKKTGVKPARVKGTDLLRFMKKPSANLEETDWTNFESTLKKHKLSVYAAGTWMKIMKE